MTEEKQSVESKFEQFMRDKSRRELGGLLAEYIHEAEFSSWEGFESRDVTGIRRLLTDMMVFHEASVRDDKTHFKDLDYYTGTYYITKDMGPNKMDLEDVSFIGSGLKDLAEHVSKDERIDEPGEREGLAARNRDLADKIWAQF